MTQWLLLDLGKGKGNAKHFFVPSKQSLKLFEQNLEKNYMPTVGEGSHHDDCNSNKHKFLEFS